MEEIWKPVIDYEGLYEISDLGRLRRTGNWIDNLGRTRIASAKALKLQRKKVGYGSYTLSKNGVRILRWAHHLVMEAFVGTRPEGKEINHKDGDKFNPILQNLEYVTHQENMIHSRKVLGNKEGKAFPGELHWKSKLTEQDVLVIRATPVVRKYGHFAALGRKYGVTGDCVGAIFHRKVWKHI